MDEKFIVKPRNLSTPPPLPSVAFTEVIRLLRLKQTNLSIAYLTCNDEEKKIKLKEQESRLYNAETEIENIAYFYGWL